VHAVARPALGMHSCTSLPGPLQVTLHTGRMQPLPAWTQTGAIVGYQGGTDAVRNITAQLALHGVPVAGMWLQVRLRAPTPPQPTRTSHDCVTMVSRYVWDRVLFHCLRPRVAVLCVPVCVHVRRWLAPY
jgi:hypothetical protein